MAVADVPDEIFAQWLAKDHYRRDRWAFLTEQCWTKDEVAPDEPIKLFPALPHLKYILKLWETERLLAVPKSRRMMMTWLMCALDLHLAMYVPHSAVYIVSSDLAKSEKLVGRCKFIYDRLDEKQVLKPTMSMRLGVRGDPTKLTFESGATIEALPGEPEKLRQESASLVHWEEIGSWQTDTPERAWKAILPTLQSSKGSTGGRVVVVSSARAGSFFHRLVTDNLGVAVGG